MIVRTIRQKKHHVNPYPEISKSLKAHWEESCIGFHGQPQADFGDWPR
jgi:hypothetical protein